MLGTIGERIQWAMARKNVSRAQISDACGVSAAAVGHWIVGTSYPRPRNIDAMAGLLGVSAAWIQYGGPFDDDSGQRDLLLRFWEKMTPAARFALLKAAEGLAEKGGGNEVVGIHCKIESGKPGNSLPDGGRAGQGPRGEEGNGQ